MTGIQTSLPIKMTPIVIYAVGVLKEVYETQTLKYYCCMCLNLHIRPYARVVHRTIRVAVDDFSRCPGSYSSHASALNLASYTTHYWLYHFTTAVPEAISTNLLRGCLNGEVNLSPWNGGWDLNPRWQLGFDFAVSEPHGSHFYGCCLTT